MEMRFFKVTKEDAHLVLPDLGISNSNNGFHLSLNDNQSTCFFLFNCGFQCHATSGATVTCSISFAGIVEGVSPLWNPQKICATGAVPVDKGNMFTTVLGAPYPLKYHGYTHETHPNCTPNRSFPALKWNMTTKQP